MKSSDNSHGFTFLMWGKGCNRFCDLKPDSTARCEYSSGPASPVDGEIVHAEEDEMTTLRAPFSFLLHFFSLFILRIWISFLRLVHAEEDEMTRIVSAHLTFHTTLNRY